jgi:hypothetical protein
MGTLHEFKPRPRNKGQFEGPSPGIPLKERRARPSPHKADNRRMERMLVALAWTGILSAVVLYAVLF